eukprot:COSAG05_NODE_13669_length_421_cov_11.363354_1_plen_78_part_00
MGAAPVPISVSRGHFALRYEVPKFLARGGHLCMAVLTIAAMVRSTIHVWRMGGSRGLLAKTLLYTQTMCPTYPEATY